MPVHPKRGDWHVFLSMVVTDLDTQHGETDGTSEAGRGSFGRLNVGDLQRCDERDERIVGDGDGLAHNPGVASVSKQQEHVSSVAAVGFAP